MLKKTIQRSEELFVQFTEEELSALDVKPGDKFSWEIREESIVLQKYKTIEIDLSDFSRETLESLIVESVEKDISVNEVIEQLLETIIEHNNG